MDDNCTDIADLDMVRCAACNAPFCALCSSTINYLEANLFNLYQVFFFCSASSRMTNHVWFSLLSWKCCVCNLTASLPTRCEYFLHSNSSHTLIQNVAGFYHCAGFGDVKELLFFPFCGEGANAYFLSSAYIYFPT